MLHHHNFTQAPRPGPLLDDLVNQIPQHILLCEGPLVTSDQRKKPHRRHDEACCL